MSFNEVSNFYLGDRYSVQLACEHCTGTVRHEPWCITLNPRVYYAHQIIVDPSQLTVHDRLILHSLGVAWNAKPCQGARSGTK